MEDFEIIDKQVQSVNPVRKTVTVDASAFPREVTFQALDQRAAASGAATRSTIDAQTIGRQTT